MTNTIPLLQNQWYQALTGAMSLEPSLFQLRAPWIPLAAADSGLWPYEDVVPPSSMTFNAQLCGAPEFFSEYAGIVTQLQFPQSTFESDIGEANYDAWTKYLVTISPPPTPAQLPVLFQRWAAVNAPSVSSIGVADLSSMALIDAAQQAITPYLGPDPLPPDYTGTYAQLQQSLADASPVSLSFDSGNPTPSRPGYSSSDCLWGLWTGSSPHSVLSDWFAMHEVTVSLKMNAFVIWPAMPGAWYNSAMLNTALSTPGTPPWPANANPTWSQTFGPGGTMLRAVGALVIAAGLTATTISQTGYSDIDQQLIDDNAAAGLWPFYTPEASEVTFSDDSMTITTEIPSASPFVIGENVLPIAQYLGQGG